VVVVTVKHMMKRKNNNVEFGFEILDKVQERRRVHFAAFAGVTTECLSSFPQKAERELEMATMYLMLSW
jgi:hypothetical protein